MYAKEIQRKPIACLSQLLVTTAGMFCCSLACSDNTLIFAIFTLPYSLSLRSVSNLCPVQDTSNWTQGLPRKLLGLHSPHSSLSLTPQLSLGVPPLKTLTICFNHRGSGDQDMDISFRSHYSTDYNLHSSIYSVNKYLLRSLYNQLCDVYIMKKTEGISVLKEFINQ